jgi:hypothetical protein
MNREIAARVATALSDEDSIRVVARCEAQQPGRRIRVHLQHAALLRIERRPYERYAALLRRLQQNPAFGRRIARVDPERHAIRARRIQQHQCRGPLATPDRQGGFAEQAIDRGRVERDLQLIVGGEREALDILSCVVRGRAEMRGGIAPAADANRDGLQALRERGLAAALDRQRDFVQIVDGHRLGRKRDEREQADDGQGKARHDSSPRWSITEHSVPLHSG